MSEQNGQRDAHVQVLTAEVRTLMVGSRQVTLSVFNQLDDVHPHRVAPFGRVNPRGDWWKLWTVGCDTSTGALVRSWVFSDKALGKLIESDGFFGTTGSWMKPDRWTHPCVPGLDDTAGRDWIAGTTMEWEDLPLIVLAGLR